MVWYLLSSGFAPLHFVGHLSLTNAETSLFSVTSMTRFQYICKIWNNRDGNHHKGSIMLITTAQSARCLVNLRCNLVLLYSICYSVNIHSYIKVP